MFPYLLLCGFLLGHTLTAVVATSNSDEQALYESYSHMITNIKSAMLDSMRASWEQGTALGSIIELSYPQYSVFGDTPFISTGAIPISALHLALSAVVRQSSDGRLSQVIGDALDGAALDGASAGSGVLLGSFTDPLRSAYWANASKAQLDFLLYKAPRTSTGAISHRIDSKQYWADGVYMGPPFIAYYGAVTQNQTLLQLAYDNCRLYRDALLVPGPTGNLWAHIYSDDNKTFFDEGIWGTEILDGEFAALTPQNLVPDYLTGGSPFGDASSSAALSSVAYRASTLFPDHFPSNYTDVAARIRDAVIGGVDELGVLSPVVDPLSFGVVGVLSTEGQAFAGMMFSAWRDWICWD
ncbi:hypothetical protein JAAARDRAFT_45012 [Jaapia argillacea MUCL 33604]|uniref:Uncharacterized protein n=1 Tax=Jaapia argillacea MUCL 33604 TaxID=933084 RepID=A0A067QJK9_9AGAM|nr:hypothetical protein JAAARDRAFT_45012 [Jaapia argillacea MUCL 33604]